MTGKQWALHRNRKANLNHRLRGAKRNRGLAAMVAGGGRAEEVDYIVAT